jgi:hypothetical protein
MGRKNRRSNRGMNRRSKRSKRNRRTNMRGGSGSAEVAPQIHMVIRNVGVESIKVVCVSDPVIQCGHILLELPPYGITNESDLFNVGSEWRVTGAVNKELSWVLRGEVTQIIDVNFTLSSASVTVSNEVVREAHGNTQAMTQHQHGTLGSLDWAPPLPTFKESTALRQYPLSATPWGVNRGAPVTVSSEEVDYIQEWKQTNFYKQLFPHTVMVMSHVLFNKGDKDGNFKVYRDSNYGDPGSSRAVDNAHYITHTPSGKSYNETSRFRW